MTADKLRFAQQLFAYNCAGLEFIEIVKIHNGVVLVERGVVKSAFWQSPDQRHLSTFKPETNASAGTRFLPFVAFTARFSVSGALTTPQASDARTRPRTGPEVRKKN